MAVSPLWTRARRARLENDAAAASRVVPPSSANVGHPLSHQQQAVPPSIPCKRVPRRDSFLFIEQVEDGKRLAIPASNPRTSLPADAVSISVGRSPLVEVTPDVNMSQNFSTAPFTSKKSIAGNPAPSPHVRWAEDVRGRKAVHADRPFINKQPNPSSSTSASSTSQRISIYRDPPSEANPPSTAKPSGAKAEEGLASNSSLAGSLSFQIAFSVPLAASISLSL
ncbi:hypothetical protein C8Q74DRAFT_1371703 [Fomes fomentarius]|nr:hypothetical protein C8Q74DRAFT_1371703 [Fomes fomentarius]